MSETELKRLIQHLGIKAETVLNISFIENKNIVVYKSKIEFYNNQQPAIENGIVGLRIQRIKNADYMPYPGGLKITNILQMDIDNE